MNHFYRLTIFGLFGQCITAASHNDASQKPLNGQPVERAQNPFDEHFNAFVCETLNYWHVPGMAVGVIDGNDTFTKGYGFATLPDVPATPETLWYGASTSKAQVAASLSKLIHSKKYSELANGWSTPISSIIRDDFVLKDEWATRHITLNDAAGHRTGLASHDIALMREVNGKNITQREAVRNMRHLYMFAEPRVKYVYCNLMYIVFGHVLEVVTGKWIGDVLRDLIWKPLEMNSTYIDLQDALDAPEHMASGYFWDDEAGKYNEVPYMTVTEVAGAGGVISNVNDYLKWVRALLNKDEVFSRDVHEDIRKPRVISGGSPDGGYVLYGLGWERSILHNHIVYKHAGGMHAYGTEVFWMPEINFGVVAFGNTAVLSNAAELDVVYRLVEDRLKIAAEHRIDSRSSMRKLLDGMKAPLRNPLDHVFPDRPKTPLPSTFNISQLQGSYYNVGYGTLTLHEEQDPENPRRSVLIADRPDSTWKYRLEMRHATGDYWITFIWMTGHRYTYESSVKRGQFLAGVDGGPVALEIDLGDLEGVVLFDRVD